MDLGAYGLRVWIEQGFRPLKRIGWPWQHTRRTDPARVDRHWLVLAVATLWVLAHGTRVGKARLRAPTTPEPVSAGADARSSGCCTAATPGLECGRSPCRARTRPGNCNR